MLLSCLENTADLALHLASPSPLIFTLILAPCEHSAKPVLQRFFCSSKMGIKQTKAFVLEASPLRKRLFFDWSYLLVHIYLFKPLYFILTSTVLPKRSVECISNLCDKTFASECVCTNNISKSSTFS